MQAPTIVWFRRNLRLTDNAALSEAAASGAPVVPVYVHDDPELGGASRWWLHYSLVALADGLSARGSKLLIRQGDTANVLAELAESIGAVALHFAHRYEPAERSRERRVEDRLSSLLELHAYDDALLHHPDTVRTRSGTPFKIFTPYWKTATTLGDPPQPIPAPDTLKPAPADLDTLEVADLGLLPTAPDWAGGLRETWRPGEDSALERLDLVTDLAARYDEQRDRPDVDGTSRLSPHLHFGELSPRQAWQALQSAADTAPSRRGYDALLRQLYWREFSTYLLFHFPRLPSRPLRDEFEHFPWSNDPALLSAWQRGRTGFPIVDAGMRQLWHTGWMHNRVRMVVASLLVKNLMVDWQTGADWFLDTLVDADLANNSAGWQWVAGCGTDAAPYFRIFNPIRQSEKFDPNANYIRRWVPELAGLGNKSIHAPWEADSMTLELAGVSLGRDYPLPIVDLKVTRGEALDAYKSLRSLLQSPAASPGSSAG